MTEADRDPCHGCTALILRDGRYPDCQRAALYGQPGCLRARYCPTRDKAPAEPQPRKLNGKRRGRHG